MKRLTVCDFLYSKHVFAGGLPSATAGSEGFRSGVHHDGVPACRGVACAHAAAAMCRRLRATPQVMVARPESRRKGLATEALQLFLAYAVAKSIVAIGFVAKIKEWNTPSLAMFRKLGFTESQRVAAFREVHLILEPASAPDAWADLARRARDLTIDVAPAEADLAEHQAVR